MQADKLMAAVDAEWVAARTRELVEVLSVTMAEAEVCRLYEEMMRDIGLEVDVREVTPGRNNLYARIAGCGDGPALMLNGHLDTIPVGNCPPCYREGDRIYGRGTTSTGQCLEAARAYYAERPFVRVTERPPQTKWASGLNLAFVSYAADPGRDLVIAMGVVDNLGKGAAGHAVQNANLICGLPETAGLEGAPVWP